MSKKPKKILRSPKGEGRFPTVVIPQSLADLDMHYTGTAPAKRKSVPDYQDTREDGSKHHRPANPKPMEVEDEQEALRRARVEKIERLQRKVWQKYPLDWLRDRLGENPLDYKWSDREGYAQHAEWDADKDPLYEAWMSLANGQWVGVEAATGTSKTFWLSRVVLWFLDCFEDSLVVTSAPKQEQLKLHLWSELTKAFPKFKQIRPESALYTLKLKVEDSQTDEQKGNSDADLSQSWQAVGFIAGAGAEEESATKAQGFHRANMLIICEETPGMPMSVLTAFKNTSTGEKNLILAVGNPDSELDPLHQFCLMEHVKHVRISAYDYPNVVEDREIIAGAVTRASINRRKIEYGEDSLMYKSRVRGISPTQSSSSLIRLEWVDKCLNSPCEETAELGYSAGAVDVANSENGDKASVAYGTGNVLKYIKEFQCPNATHLAYNLIYSKSDLLEKGYTDYELEGTIYDYGIDGDLLGVDSVGVGVATLNALIDEGVDAMSLQGGQWDEAIPLDENDKPKYKFANLRTQMWWQMREDLRLKQINLEVTDTAMILKIRQELTSVKFNLKSNTVAIERKDEIRKRIGKSPNVGDVLVYWNWMRHGYRTQGDALPLLAGNLT